ncbi:Unclassified tail protein [Pseudomonas orientalis]|uniref:phage tail protein n=1 Tax=Pseudomonas fluorescens group TaxID=136843 RepID=UPI000F57BBB4|nr:MULTISPECIES: phage tail protein [Pseudomonas fluorescens group]AZE93322.1 Unclassified tail protein [Pseudomonas orientalis]MDQ0650421.1 phage protein U [Pseudomonas cedrina]
MRQQMVLGTFIFGLSRGFAYDSLDRGSSGGWVSLDIIAGKPKSSQVGQDLETLAVGGKAARANGMQRLDELRALQALRVPLPLVDGLGRNWGLWTIKSISEKQTSVIDDGTAMAISWSLILEEFVNA